MPRSATSSISKSLYHLTRKHSNNTWPKRLWLLKWQLQSSVPVMTGRFGLKMQMIWTEEREGHWYSDPHSGLKYHVYRTIIDRKYGAEVYNEALQYWSTVWIPAQIDLSYPPSSLHKNFEVVLAACAANFALNTTEHTIK